MKCYRCQKLLIPYAEGDLDERTSQAVERHVAVCQSCARDLEHINVVRDSLSCSHKLRVTDEPDIWPRLSPVIAKMEVKPARPRRVRFRFQAASALVGAVLVAAIGLYAVRSHFQPARVPEYERGSRPVSSPVESRLPQAGERTHSSPAEAVSEQIDEHAGADRGGTARPGFSVPGAEPGVFAPQAPPERPRSSSPAVAGQAQPRSDLEKALDEESRADAARVLSAENNAAVESYYRSLMTGRPDTWPKTIASAADSGALEGVEARFAEAFSRNPDRRTGAALLEIRAFRHDDSGVIQTASKLVELFPDDGSFWLRLGAAKERSGDAIGARAAYQRAVECADAEAAAAAEKGLNRLAGSSRQP